MSQVPGVQVRFIRLEPSSATSFSLSAPRSGQPHGSRRPQTESYCQPALSPPVTELSTSSLPELGLCASDPGKGGGGDTLATDVHAAMPTRNGTARYTVRCTIRYGTARYDLRHGARADQHGTARTSRRASSIQYTETDVDPEDTGR